MARRVIRSDSTDGINSVPPQKETSKLRRFLLWIFCFIWKTIKVIWYWCERAFLLVFLLILTVGLAWWLSQKPSLYRDWEDMDAVLPTISWSGNSVTIENIRNHTWKTDTEFTP